MTRPYTKTRKKAKSRPCKFCQLPLDERQFAPTSYTTRPRWYHPECVAVRVEANRRANIALQIVHNVRKTGIILRRDRGKYTQVKTDSVDLTDKQILEKAGYALDPWIVVDDRGEFKDVDLRIWQDYTGVRSPLHLPHLTPFQRIQKTRGIPTRILRPDFETEKFE